MYTIRFYKNKRGKELVKEYIKDLERKNDKNSRIELNKIREYIGALSVNGLSLGEPFIKHLKGEIWELRPRSDRILFVTWENDTFILLHMFKKKTQKTPRREIEKALREVKDIKERLENE